MKKRESPENITQIYGNNFFLPRQGRAKKPHKILFPSQRKGGWGRGGVGGEWWGRFSPNFFSLGKESTDQLGR